MTNTKHHYRGIRTMTRHHVPVVPVAKTRTVAEIAAAIRAGISAVGHSYVQEAERMAAAMIGQATRHMLDTRYAVRQMGTTGRATRIGNTVPNGYGIPVRRRNWIGAAQHRKTCYTKSRKRGKGTRTRNGSLPGS